MKKLTTILLICIIPLILNSCGDTSTPNKQTTAITIPADDQPEVTEPEEDATTDTDTEPAPDDTQPEPEPAATTAAEPEFQPRIIIAIQDNIYFSDHNTLQLKHTGTADLAAARTLIIDGMLVTYTDTGEIDSSTDYAHVPTKARMTDNGLYSCIEYDPDTAASLGAQPRYYYEIYLDGALMSQPWYFNQDRCQDIVSVDNNVWIIDEFGGYILIDGTAPAPIHVMDGNLYTHSLDTINRTIDINTRVESYIYNYVTGASAWIKYSDLYYSETGATWSPGTGLDELATAMQGWNEEPYPIEMTGAPTMVSVGARDGVLCWIEANTGHIIALDVATDSISYPWRIYDGDGTRATGTAARETLSPVLSDQYVYYSAGGALNRLDLDTGFIGVVYAGPAVVWEF